MKSKILVTGASGLVGSRFIELHKDKSELLTPPSKLLDICNSKAVEEYFSKENISVVVHFAAFTDVSSAENQRGNINDAAFQVNVVGTENIASACQKSGAFLIHISTDMVFPGSKNKPGPYSEDEMPETDPSKITWYGFTKAESERKVSKILDKDQFSIIRIIYPVRARFAPKLDYLRKPLSLFDKGELYPLFSDQQVSISFIDEVAQVAETIIKKRYYGIFHASTRDLTTPFEIVSYLIKKVRDKNAIIKSGSIEEFYKKGGNPVRYPRWGGLKVEKTQKTLGISFSSWKEVVDKLIKQGVDKLS